VYVCDCVCMQQTVARYKNLKHQYSLAMKVHKGRWGRNGLKSESYLIYGCKIVKKKGMFNYLLHDSFLYK